MSSWQVNRPFRALSRRQMLRATAAAAGCALVSATGCSGGSVSQQTQPAPAWPPDLPVGTFAPSAADEAFLDALEQQGCLYFWEQANPANGQVLDHAANNLGGALDTSTTESSIAATGFGSVRVVHRRPARLLLPRSDCCPRPDHAGLSPELHAARKTASSTTSTISTPASHFPAPKSPRWTLPF